MNAVSLRPFTLAMQWRSRQFINSSAPTYPFSSVNLEMTVPRVKSDLLMKAPSLRRSSFDEAFSDPAKSIKFSCDTLTALADLDPGFRAVGLPAVAGDLSLLSMTCQNIESRNGYRELLASD